MPALYVATTSHGYGHAIRTSRILAEIRKRKPEVELIINTSLPERLFSSVIPGDIIFRDRPLDVGIVQSDSRTMDLPETLRRAVDLQNNGMRIAEQEGLFLKENNVDVVFGDIPPLASLVAHEAGVPCFQAGNFGWDFIYASLGKEFEEITDWYRFLYSQTDMLFRYPFSEPMSSFPRQLEVGLPVGKPRFSPEEVRRKLGLAPNDYCITIVFGGMGLAGVPYDNIDRFTSGNDRRVFLLYDKDLALQKENAVYAGDLTVVDLLQVSKLIFTKAGFGVLTDVFGAKVPIITVERNNFIEVPYLNAGLQKYFQWREVEERELFSDDWSFLLDPPAAISGPTPVDSLSTDGAQVIASRLLQALGYRQSDGPGAFHPNGGKI